MPAARAKPVPEQPKAKRWCAQHTAGDEPRFWTNVTGSMKQGSALTANGRAARAAVANWMHERLGRTNRLQTTVNAGTVTKA